ncbi:DUF2075 domain-containing protein [Staphylococcus epidermidis]|nr:DUF2075 domain-containing protein [Staphylococcus epidermidis]
MTQEQINAKEEILTKIKESILLNEDGQLIIVEGEAGSGKTVLMSTLLYELGKYNLDLDENLDIHLLVNHNEHVSIYSQIASKLGIANKKKKKIVQKPTSFINNNSSDEKVDVVIVDEAHLLLTQGKQSYQGKNHLDDLLARAKVVVIVFDIKQVLTTEQIWEVDKLNEYFDKAKSNSNHVTLRNQMRINSDISTVNWIRNLVDYQVINSIPKDKLGYDIKIFDTPDELEKAIKIKAAHTDSGISRMLATFDWKYGTKPPNNEDFWRVKIGNWSMPWNYQLKVNRNQVSLPWVEQDQTIDEIGSTFTIQGLDLNFAGVIIGPSVKYRDGKIIFDKSESANKKATQRRTLKDGSKQYFSEMLLKNELNVLLTRGVNGLYIYAVDDQLREALKIAAKDESNG